MVLGLFWITGVFYPQGPLILSGVIGARNSETLLSAAVRSAESRKADSLAASSELLEKAGKLYGALQGKVVN